MNEPSGSPSLEGLRIPRNEEPPPGKGKRMVWLLLASVGVVALLGVFWFVLWPDAKIEVEIETVQASPSAAAGGASVLDASGYVTARRSATVSSKRTGRIRTVLVEEGMNVEEGQIVAELDDAAELAQLRLAEAQLKYSQSALGETRAALREAELAFGRLSELREQGLASESELDAARASRDSLSARLESNEADVEVARRVLEVQRQNHDETIVRAPFAGVVVDKNAQPGEMVSPVSAGGGFTRTGICTLVDMESLEIEVDVNEAYLQRVREGGAVTARLDAYPDWFIPAEVIKIVPTANREKATVRVRVGILQNDSRILPDMGAKVSFIAPGEAPEAPPPAGVSIAAAALEGPLDNHWVFVVSEGRAWRREVTVGARDSRRVTILSGLAPGEKVILDPPSEIEDGAEVENP